MKNNRVERDKEMSAAMASYISKAIAHFAEHQKGSQHDALVWGLQACTLIAGKYIGNISSDRANLKQGIDLTSKILKEVAVDEWEEKKRQRI